MFVAGKTMEHLDERFSTFTSITANGDRKLTSFEIKYERLVVCICLYIYCRVLFYISIQTYMIIYVYTHCILYI